MPKPPLNQFWLAVVLSMWIGGTAWAMWALNPITAQGGVCHQSGERQ